MTALLDYARELKQRWISRGDGVPFRYFARFLPDNPVIIEAGAHNGIDTGALAKTWPQGQVHAFEPVPALFQEARRHNLHLRNVRLNRAALGATPGKAIFHVSAGGSDGSGSLLEPTGHLEAYPDTSFDQAIEVDVLTLTDYARVAGLDRLDFLWLDMQGGELAAMQGAGDLMNTCRVIYTEVQFKPQYKNAPVFDDMKHWLASRGLYLVAHEISDENFGNAIFARD